MAQLKDLIVNGSAKFLGQINAPDFLLPKNYNEVYAQGRNLASSTTATVTIAASDTPEYLKSTADYICSGTSDQDTIYEAMDNAFNNNSFHCGKIVLLNGTFNVDRAINMDFSDVIIEGMGSSTIINSTISFNNQKIFDISTEDVTNVTIKDLFIRANTKNYIDVYAINIDGVNCINVDNVIFELSGDQYHVGINAYGSEKMRIKNCHFQDSSVCAFFQLHTVSNSIITNNFANTIHMEAGIFSNCRNIIVTNNVFITEGSDSINIDMDSQHLIIENNL